MTACDTNVLVHAHRGDSIFHATARAAVARLAESAQPWGIPLHCLVEFYGVVTNRSLWKTPSTPKQARTQIEAWRASPSLVVLGDEDHTLQRLLDMAVDAHIAGSKIHDARIAAICLAHGITELLSVDRDFSRFPALHTRNPCGASA